MGIPGPVEAKYSSFLQISWGTNVNIKESLKNNRNRNKVR